MKDTGGPAFPYSYEVTPGVERHTYLGMTLRDYFAAKAMQGLLSSTKTGDARVIAKDAYSMADAMLAERSKT